MFDFIAQAAEPVITGLDVVKAVDAFYHNAWLKLVVVFAFFGAMIGVVMPLIIQRIQSSSFDKTEKRLKDEIEQIKNITHLSIQEEVEALRSTFDEIQKNLEKQIDKRTRLNRAEFYHQLATCFSLDSEQKCITFIFHITAAREYATLKDYESLTKELNRAISDSAGEIHLLSATSTAKTKEMSKETQAACLEQVDGIRKMLEGQGAISRYSEQLEKVYEICNNLLIVADKPE
ncbi:MAG TPA: hypothetical protein VMW72_21555 [Sedimentisphaerales bacterium]|nr:hypothetical protein [Sedimentisphaerales bacterium]